MNSLGAVAVVLKGGQALTGGELVAGSIVDFEYDGTSWQASGTVAYLDIGAGLRNDGSGNLQVNEFGLERLDNSEPRCRQSPKLL